MVLLSCIYILYKRKYSIDDNYFSKIDNQNKAYILGFMYADGAIYPRRAKLDLQIDDLYILEQIQKEMNIEMPIKIYKNQKTWFYDKEGNKVFYPKKDTARLWMNSEIISNDLSKCGCIQHKTYDLKFPNNLILPKNLVSHFIRGYFDGDGCLTYSERKSTNSCSKHFCMDFTGTYNIVSTIKEILNDECVNFVGDIRSRKNNGKNNYTLKICGNNILLKICEYLYRDANLMLNRKYNKYMLLKEEIDRRDNNPYFYNKKIFKLYKDGEYIDTYEGVNYLENISKEKFGTKLHHSCISACINNKYGKTNVYKGFSFEPVF